MDKTRTAPTRKAEGAHYTPTALATFVAKRMVDAWHGPISTGVAVLDPAVGDGALLVALLHSLRETRVRVDHATGFDTSAEALGRARTALDSTQMGDNLALHADDFLDAVSPALSGQASFFATAPDIVGSFDMVIANPPYVRTQVMGAERSQRLAKTFDLTGRVDLYFAFIRAIGNVLKPQGVAGIIASNRFMTTQSGASLREAIRADFDILSVHDFGDTRLFEAAVLPAVLILRRRNCQACPEPAAFTSIYSVREACDADLASDVFDAIEKEGRHRLPSGEVFEVKRGRLDVGASPGATWRLSTDEGDSWLECVAAHTVMTFADVGPIRVGIKTTADKVFVRSDWDQMPLDETPELLRPIITHHGARRFRSARPSSAPRVLYTHTTENGCRVPVSLEDYPRAARYLERHRALLEGRAYVRDAGRKWYEIWVPQDPDAWRLPKLVFRDISEEPIFWIDLDGSVVNGDCYWQAVEEDKADLLYLAAAVGNSTFVEAFYDYRFNNKLYAGRRRFITQYVRDFPLPDPSSTIAREMIAMARQLAQLSPPADAGAIAARLDDLTWCAFGLRGEEVGR